LLDIGGGTTEVIVYGGGVVRHTSAVAIGGDHFTNDLAVGLRTPIPEAERIKRRHGCAASAFHEGRWPDRDRSVGDRPPRTIFAHMLTDIIERAPWNCSPSFATICSAPALTARFLPDSFWRAAGARLHGLDELAEESFHLPVRVAEPKGLADLPEQVAHRVCNSRRACVIRREARRSSRSAQKSCFQIEVMFAGAS